MDRAKTILYFGYGSNMSTQYLIKRRKIIPHESKVGVLKDYQLIMNMGGPNFLEPSFANIRNCKGVTVEGVIHKIDREDLQKIVNTEGEDYKLVKLSVYIEGSSLSCGLQLKKQLLLMQRLSTKTINQIRFMFHFQ